MGWIEANFEHKPGNNGWIRICNPLQEKETNTPDTKFHLNINLKTGSVHDWRPNWQHSDGHIIKFAQNYLNCSFKEAIAAIKACKVVNVDIDDVPSAPTVVHLELPESWPFDGTGPLKIENMAVNYLQSRKISKATAIDWGIRYGIGIIVFPYIEYGEVVYWQSREIANKRFLFPSVENGAAKLLYGWHMIEPGDDAYITESLFGAVSIGRGAISSGGASLSQHQIDKLDVIRPNRVILCPDNDEAGLASIVSNYNKLTKYHNKLWFCVPPKINDAKDWNDYAKLGENVRGFIDGNIKPLTISVVMEISRKLKKQQENNNFRKRVL